MTCVDEISAGVASFTGACSLDLTSEISDPVLSFGGSNCNEAVYEMTYSVADACDREASCIQTFTLDQPLPTITCPDQTITCQEVDAFVPELALFAGVCDNQGSIPGVVTTPFTGCADGELIVTYSGNDLCNNALSQECTVTVIGAGPATIACPDLTITCVEADAYTPVDASFTGDCGNEGTISGIVSIEYTGCAAGTLTVTYDGTDECGCLLYTSDAADE